MTRSFFLSILVLFCLAACQPDQQAVVAGRSGGAPSPTKTPVMILRPVVASARIERAADKVVEITPTTVLPTATATETVPTATGLPPTALPSRQIWQWQPVGNLVKESMPNAFYNGKDLTWVEKVWKKQRLVDVLYTQRGGEAKNVLYEAPLGWNISSLQASGGRLAFITAAPEEPYQLWLFDLASGEHQVIGARDGDFKDPNYPPNLALDDFHLVWNSAKPDGRTCLRMLDLLTNAFSELFCAESAQDQLVAQYLRWPVVTYSRTVTDKGTRYFGPEIRDLGENPGNVDCSGNSPVSDGTVLRCLGQAPGTDGIPSAGSIPLAFDSTLQVCSGRAFWLADQQVHSWMPGGAEEIIYRAIDGTEKIEALHCSSSWVTLTLSGTGQPDGAFEVWAAAIQQ